MLKFRNYLVLVVFLFTIMAGLGVSQADAAATLKDVSGHWAQATIQKLADAGVIAGNSDGTYKPNDKITRAEFATLVVKAFQLEPQTGKIFSDTTNHWAKNNIATANANGIVNGYGDRFGPDDPVTTEQMAAMVVKAAKLAPSPATLTFKDTAQISSWAINNVTTAYANQIIVGGYDGYFNPQSNANRAQAAVVISAAMAFTTAPVTPVITPVTPGPDLSKLDKAGTYGPGTGSQTIDGNVTISASGVILQNTEITGYLLITENVGTGDVTLKNITVKGTTTVKGGGSHSVRVDSCTLGNVVIDKTGGDIRIVVSGSTTIVQVTLDSGAILEESHLTGTGFGNIIISATGAVTLNGNFRNVTIEDANANVTITGETVASLTLANKATGSTINIASGAKVTTLTTNAAVKITGLGTISTANINASGVTTTIRPAAINTASGVIVPTIITTGTSGGGSGSGSGSGAGSTVISLNNVSATLSAGGSSSYNANTKTVTLKGIGKSMLTALRVTTTPANTSCMFTNLCSTETGINIPLDKTVSCQNDISISTLLGAMDTGEPGVSIQSLVRVLGKSIALTGTLSASGYTNTTITITINLPDIAV